MQSNYVSGRRTFEPFTEDRFKEQLGKLGSEIRSVEIISLGDVRRRLSPGDEYTDSRGRNYVVSRDGSLRRTADHPDGRKPTGIDGDAA